MKESLPRLVLLSSSVTALTMQTSSTGITLIPLNPKALQKSLSFSLWTCFFYAFIIWKKSYFRFCIKKYPSYIIPTIILYCAILWTLLKSQFRKRCIVAWNTFKKASQPAPDTFQVSKIRWMLSKSLNQKQYHTNDPWHYYSITSPVLYAPNLLISPCGLYFN